MPALLVVGLLAPALPGAARDGERHPALLASKLEALESTHHSSCGDGSKLLLLAPTVKRVKSACGAKIADETYLPDAQLLMRLTKLYEAAPCRHNSSDECQAHVEQCGQSWFHGENGWREHEARSLSLIRIRLAAEQKAHPCVTTDVGGEPSLDPCQSLLPLGSPESRPHPLQPSLRARRSNSRGASS